MTKKRLIATDPESIRRAEKIKLERRKMTKKEKEEREELEKLAKFFGGKIIDDEL